MSAASSYRHVQSRRSIIAGRPITTTTTMTHAYATIAFSFADAYDCKREGNELDCRRLMVVSSSWGRVGRKGGELHENRVEGLCKQHTFTHTHIYKSPQDSKIDPLSLTCADVPNQYPSDPSGSR